MKMSASYSQKGQPLHVDLPASGSGDRPALSALFLIQFDVKAG